MDFFLQYKARIICSILFFMIGLSIYFIGFLYTMFFVILTGIGYFIGHCIDTKLSIEDIKASFTK